MADEITENGLQVDSYDTILTNLQAGLNAIYAPDGNLINFGSETPDGQATNIFAQAGSDMRELAQEVYNSFDPDKCSGRVQDSRYALNYIFRNGGTYTIQNIDITCNQTVNLNGLDANYNDTNAAAYTVSDNSGNLWYLIDSVTLQSGTHSLAFRSQNMGLVQPVIGTITTQVTTVLGVTAVNNSVAPTTLGTEQETDSQFRVRRSRSTAVKGQNNIDALEGKLLDLEGISDAKTHVNRSGETDETGTPPWTVWVIVEGGANADIASLIYENSCGLPTRGDVAVSVPTVSGEVFITNFDRANPVPLYIRFDFQATEDLETIDFSGIKNSIVENLTYNLNETAETSKVTQAAADAIITNGGGGYALNVEISTDGSDWKDYIPSASLQNKFVVDATRITITEIEAAS